MTPEERDTIRAAAHAAWDHSRAQRGLPPQVTDPRVLEQVAAILRTPTTAAGEGQEAA